MRSSSAWIFKASPIEVPMRSACTRVRTKECISGISILQARFLSASRLIIPICTSRCISASSLVKSQDFISRTTRLTAIIKSSPPLTQIFKRSIRLGISFLICTWRFLILLESHNQGANVPKAMAQVIVIGSKKRSPTTMYPNIGTPNTEST